MNRGLPRLLLLALIGGVALAVGGVLVQGWRSAERARLLRHQLVAERLFDSMERELTTLLSTEEARPVVAYQADEGLLVEQPDHIIGWFQIDPEGAFTVPRAVEPPAEALLRQAAAEAEGWGTQQASERTNTRITMNVPVDVPRATPRPGPSPARSVPASEVQAAPSAEPAPSPVQVQAPSFDNVAQSSLPVEVQLNNAAVPRAQRSAVTQKVSKQKLALLQTKAKPEPEPEPAPAAPEPEPSEPEPEPLPPERVWVPVEVDVPVAADAELVDVLVSPFALSPGPREDTLLLSRTVRLGRRSWVQGLLVDLPGLQEHLVRTTLGDTGLGEVVEVRWAADPGPAPPGRYAFTHPFAAPFDPLTVAAWIEPLPEAERGLELAVQIGAVLLVLLAAAGLLAVYQMVVLTQRRARQREDFVSAVTHELKSPLTSIRMYSEMLETGVVDTPDGRREYASTIRTEAERLTRLVDDVLTFGRLQRGLPVAEGQTGTLAEVVGDLERLMAPQLDAAGATLEVSIDPSVADHAVDRDALSQVLTNLIDNAEKFSRDAEDRRIHLSVRPEGDRAVLCVRDHGPGVPAPLLRRMFEPFVRGERELTRRTRGTGIGLALVRRLIDRLDGSVAARNAEEGGLLVEVRLPARGR